MKNRTLQHNVVAHRSRFLLIFLVLVIIGGLIWIFVSIYSSQHTSALPPEANFAAKPLDPNLDLASISGLDTKPLYTAEELLSFPIYIIQTDRFTRTQSIVILDQ